MRPGGPSIGMFNASFALIVRTVRASVRYRKPCLHEVLGDWRVSVIQKRSQLYHKGSTMSGTILYWISI